MFENKERVCSISVDIDTLRDYLNSYGYHGEGISYNNDVYIKAIPRILDLFSSYNIKATFFVIGKDINNPENIPILKEIIKQGHEIGNHTMNHIYPFTKLSKAKKRQEILSMHRLAIEKLGYTVKGFRAPGYGVDRETVEILEEAGYEYDTSVHPTIFMILINLSIIFYCRSKKFPEIKNSFHFIAPLKSYIPKPNFIFLQDKNKKRLVEIPITVTPFLRLPFYGIFHLISAKWLFDFEYYIIRKLGLNINYEMHAIELLDSSDNSLDAWFARQPGFTIPWNQKQKKYHHILNSFRKYFSFEPIINQARSRTK